jgi:hypothetical protein
MSKDTQYWNDVEYIVSEIGRLAMVTQGPIIEEHLSPEEYEDMDIGEISAFCQERYTPEQNQMWADLEKKSLLFAMKHQVDPEEMMMDVWGTLTALPPEGMPNTAH